MQKLTSLGCVCIPTFVRSSDNCCVKANVPVSDTCTIDHIISSPKAKKLILFKEKLENTYHQNMIHTMYIIAISFEMNLNNLDCTM